MTADVDLDTLTRLAQAAPPGPWVSQYGGVTTEAEGHVSQSVVYAAPCPNACGDEAIVDRITIVDAGYIAAVSPDVVLALVERVRAAETAIERVRALAIDGPAFVPEAIRTAPESDRDGQNDPLRDSGPQNAANEGDA